DKAGLTIVTKGRVGRVGPVHVKFPNSHGIGWWNENFVVYFDKIIGRTQRRRRPIEIGGESASKHRVDCPEVKKDEARRLTEQHFFALEGERAKALRQFRIGRELVSGHIVSVGPHAQMRIIVKDAGAYTGEIKIVNIIGARRIRACRDGDAFAVWTTA